MYKISLLFFIALYTTTFKIEAQEKVFNPELKISQYILEEWNTNSGLPSNNISKIIQDRNGYIWFAGYDGLVQFDGIRFQAYNKKTQPKFFKTNVVTSIFEGRNNLWIGTQGSGLLSNSQNQMKSWDKQDLFVTTIFEVSEEKLWIGTRYKGLYNFNPKTQEMKKINYLAFENVGIYEVVSDVYGNTWFPTDGNGLVLYQEKIKQFTTYTTKNGLPSNSILMPYYDRSGIFWIGTTKGLCYKKGDEFVQIPEMNNLIVHDIIEDHAGNFWIGTSSGLFRKNALSKKFELFGAINNIMDMHLDPEGSLWIATYRSGLYRFKQGKFVNYTTTEGLASLSVGSVCEWEDNKILVGMNNGKVNIITADTVQTLPITTPVPQVRVFNLFRDSKKNIWISTFNGVIKRSPDGSEVLYDKNRGLSDNTVRLSFEDSQGNIWLGTRWGGLVKIALDGSTTVINKKNGLSSDFIMDITQDPQGNIWVGTNDGGLNVISKDLKIKIIASKQGLVSDLVFSIYIDKKNTAWITTNGGLAVINNEKVTNITSNEGLLNDSPFDIIEDNNNAFWLPHSKGVMRIERQHIEDFLAKKASKVICTNYDKDDGMKSDDCTGAAHSMKDAKGFIWIPTNGGLVRINPNSIPYNPIKPRVDIYNVNVDGKEALFLYKVELNGKSVETDSDESLQIPPHSQRLIFNYSGLSLLAPAKVRFRYKLEGFDEVWQNAGDERQVAYTNLPPGDYVFRVLACNNDGVWNEEGARVKFTILPTFYQTWWFYTLVVVFLGGLVYGVFRLRIRQVVARNQELDSLVKQRTYELSEKNRNITASIQYAKLIQDAILPTPQEFVQALPEHFVFYKPKDIVSGDFYWLAEKDDKIYLACADCTGHGVPGAFMSLIGINTLNEIIGGKSITQPHEILAELNRIVVESLKQKSDAAILKDGMEIGLCVIDKAKKIIEFAGARIPLVCVVNDQVLELKSNNNSIGGWWNSEKLHKNFSSEVFQVPEGAWFYMFSDGYKDQFGGDGGRKFMRKNLGNLLLKASKIEAKAQKELLDTNLKEWMGTEHQQIDDILVVGFRI